MLFSAAAIALVAISAHAAPAPAPQGVTAVITPTKSAPSGCLPTYSGTFGIAVMNITATSSSSGSVATQASDGQPAKGSSSAGVVTAKTDGQPNVASSKASVVTQKTDGQPNAGTSAAVVTQISDGQPQAGTKTMAAITQIGDGQIQAPHPTTVKPISQISDGQAQAPKTTSAVSQISDGQPQVPKTTSAVSQISDGQPQVKTTSSSKDLRGLPAVRWSAASQDHHDHLHHQSGVSAHRRPAASFGLCHLRLELDHADGLQVLRHTGSYARQRQAPRQPGTDRVHCVQLPVPVRQPLPRPVLSSPLASLPVATALLLSEAPLCSIPAALVTSPTFTTEAGRLSACRSRLASSAYPTARVETIR